MPILRFCTRRVLFAGAITVVVAAATVWSETALIATWAHFDFSESEESLPWPRSVPSSWPTQPVLMMRCEAHGISGEWFKAYGPEPPTLQANPTVYRLVELRIGWPLRTFQFERTLVLPDARGTIGWMMDEPESVWIGGLEVPDWMPGPDEPLPDAPQIRRIPVRPLWGGFAFAVTLHVIALLAIGLVPWWALRRLRAWRGRCMQCGYGPLPSADARCPECGSVNGVRAAAPAAPSA